jgi:hypothetical protein
MSSTDNQTLDYLIAGLAVLLLFGTLFAPRLTLAQDPPEPPPLPESEEVETSEDDDNASDETRNDAIEPSPLDVTAAQRVTLEALAGVGGFIGIGLFGGLVGAAYIAPSAVSAGFLGPPLLIAGALTGAAFGAIAGVPLGIHWIGQKTGHEGNLTVLCVATGLGLLAASGVTYLAAQNNPESVRYVAPPSFVVFPVAFGVASYEITANLREKNERAVSKKPRFSAGLGPTRDGKGATISIGARW